MVLFHHSLTRFLSSLFFLFCSFQEEQQEGCCLLLPRLSRALLPRQYYWGICSFSPFFSLIVSNLLADCTAVWFPMSSFVLAWTNPAVLLVLVRRRRRWTDRGWSCWLPRMVPAAAKSNPYHTFAGKEILCSRRLVFVVNYNSNSLVDLSPFGFGLSFV